jgi:hypothetical protein
MDEETAERLVETPAVRVVRQSGKPPDGEDTQTEVTSTASVLIEQAPTGAAPHDGSPPWLAATKPATAPSTTADQGATGAAAASDVATGAAAARAVAVTPPLFATTSVSPPRPAPGTPPVPTPSAAGPPLVRPPTPAWLSGSGLPAREDTTTDTSSLPRFDVSGRSAARTADAEREVVELLWFDPEATARVRQQWRELTAELEFAPLDLRHDLPSQDPQQARDRHTNFGVLTEVPLTDSAGLATRLREAISESGRFTPPLVVVGGKVHFPFDDLEILRATAATLTPLAGDDKKLKEALGNVQELLETPLLQHSNELVDNFTKHLRNIYGQSKRALSRDYLDTTVERMLLEERRYQKRTIFDGKWIRALLTTAGSTEPIPTYLPDSLEKTLPMMVSFQARMIVEVHVRQDQYEAHPHALRAVALGRVLELDQAK